MAARDVYTASVKTAAVAQVATVIAAETTRQVTIDASNSAVGYNNISGNGAALTSAVKAAAIAKANSLFAAEAARQAAIAVARDTLRATGDLAPT